MARAPADVVINFGRVDYLWSLLKTTTPLICQFQNPVEDSEIEFLVRDVRGPLVRERQRSPACASGRHRRMADDLQCRGYRSACVRAPPRSGYLAFIGRLTANKGVHVAIEVAKKLGRPLRIAGNVSDEAGGREYFETRVRPQLGDGIEWVGAVDDAAKVPFLQNAAALLVPIQWDEPFGLVVAEALACGTPVIAMLRGSMPELIRHGVTAFLCRSTDEMMDAVGRLGAIDRRACREDCEARFSADRMVEDYLAAAMDLIGAPRPAARTRDLPKIACGEAR